MGTTGNLVRKNNLKHSTVYVGRWDYKSFDCQF